MAKTLQVASALVAAGFLLACSSAPTQRVTDESSVQVAQREREIAILEDRRTIGANAELLAFVDSDDPLVRARAATAIGRLRFPNGGEATTAKLLGLLSDSNQDVRAAAAFALGMREDPAAYEAIIALGVGAKKDASPLVRARALEAASKLGRTELTELFLSGLEDGSPEVRLEAAVGAARWKTDDPRASDVNARLAAFVAQETDLRVRTYGLFALERRKAVEGRGVFQSCAKSADVEERLFAVHGLAAIPGTPEVEEALIEMSRDADWRIAVEALRGLAQCSSLPALEAIAAGIGSGSHHVRAVALETAAEQFDAFHSTGRAWTTQGVGNFDRIWADPSMAVRISYS
jgi:HEAT repeat protein